MQDITAKTKVKKADLLIYACLLVLAGAAVITVHFGALESQALYFDDENYFTENPLVQNPGWPSAKRFLTEVLEPSTIGGYYQPLTMISLMIDYAIGGTAEDLRQFHRTNISLHTANTILVILFLYFLFNNFWAALGAGLLFGLHPMTVESMCWVGDRKTLLAAFFVLCGLLFYLGFTRKRNRSFYLAGIICYTLALMSKPTSIALPGLMLLIDYWPLKRLNRPAVIEKVPLFAIGLIFAGITYISQSRTAITEFTGSYGHGKMWLIICHNIVFYINKIFWPVKLSSYYAYPEPLSLANRAVLIGVIGTALLIAILCVSLRRTRSLMTGWLFFFVAILPAMGVVRVASVIAADKYAYLPSLGFVIVIAAFFAWLIKYPKMRIVLLLVVSGLCIAEAAATRNHIKHWSDTIALHEYILETSPNEAAIHYNLGNAFSNEGDMERALAHYKKAVKYDPDSFKGHNNIAVTLARLGRFPEAIEHFQIVLKIDPDYPDGYFNLAKALESSGNNAAAIQCYQRALQLRPGYIDAHINFASLLSSMGETEKSISHFEEAIRLSPENAIARNNYANTLVKAGQVKAAVEQLLTAVRLSPAWPVPLNTLANILAAYPDVPIRDAQAALVYAERAAELTRYQDAAALETLARVYTVNNRLDDAIAAVQKAIDIAAKTRNDVFTESLRKQLEYYRWLKENPKPAQQLGPLK